MLSASVQGPLPLLRHTVGVATFTLKVLKSAAIAYTTADTLFDKRAAAASMRV
jgi:hypothetical protein